VKELLGNDSSLLKEISNKLISDLEKKGVDEHVIFDIHVSFEEALRNAMMHGNKLDPSKKVSVETDVTDVRVAISVEDEGEGFDPDKLPDPTSEENILKESGRGVYLIKHLMDEVSYENGGRKVVMVKKLDKKKS
jgi:serine/threonine-protein kinase RsbW